MTGFGFTFLGVVHLHLPSSFLFLAPFGRPRLLATLGGRGTFFGQFRAPRGRPGPCLRWDGVVGGESSRADELL